MIKTLVAIEIDLASNMAIRYACQLGNVVPIELHPIYIKKPPFDLVLTGVGWAQRTWEKEMVVAGREEIQEMLEAEMESCPVLQEPRVIYGDRETEILNIIEREGFDLYIEGAPYPFTASSIAQRLKQKLYQRLSIPFIWLRTTKKINQILILVTDAKGLQTLIPVVSKLWSECSVPIHMGVLNKDLMPAANAAKDELSAAGLAGVSLHEIADFPAELRNYGLVMIRLNRGFGKDHPFLQQLVQIKVPVMITLSDV